ncbi:MAG: GGDEF domain-containing protein [Candidatus Eremiobacteraeota bacterium]|nr:GGDEF domain-containing protein [Candidatus Eremiobacteraeota bacterium]MBV8222505.1 GGDEF domain-containing protein [Candidatus Eremiobacteraeota bacterium]
MIVAVARWLAVAQVALAPMSVPAPLWLIAGLFGYALVATALAAMPRLSKKPQDKKDDLPEISQALIILLDVAAATSVGWYSGISALPLIVGLDAATLSDVAAVAFILLSAGCLTFAIYFGHPLDDAGHPVDMLQIIGYTVALPLIAFISAAHGLLGRRRAEQQTRAIMRVLDAGSDLGTKVTLSEALTQLVVMLREFRESVPWSNVVIYITRSDDEETQDEVLVEEAVEGAYSDFYRGSKLRFGEGIVGFAAAEQRAVIVPDIQKDYREASLPRPKAAHGSLVVPIVSERQTIGAVMLIAPKVGAFTFEQQRLVDRLVRLAAVGIQNARLHSKTLELAETDSMTGLLTNRAYQERLESEFRKAQLTKQSLALLILDVDFFKHVNDTYGHPQGDELLRQLGEVIRMHARKIDICCRYGGDEFVVLMPETIKAEAAMVAGRLRQAIEQNEFTLETTTAKITVSVGVAGYPQDVSTKQQLVKAADSALYAAKQSGRNNVKLATRETLPIRM